MPETVTSEELKALVGQQLEPSAWFPITQERVNQFADTTNDHQFIHVDAAKAGQTPFGGTIAHGFLSLSLISHFMFENAPKLQGTAMTINYGSDKVRYLAPVRVGKRVQAIQKILDVNEKKPGQWLVKTEVTIEIEDEATPALVAEVLMMHFVA